MTWLALKDRVGRIPHLGPASQALWGAARHARKELKWLSWRMRGKRKASPVALSGPLSVAIVAQHPSLVRERKLGQAARSQGLRVVLIATSPLSLPSPPTEFHEIHQAEEAAGVLRVLERRPVDIVHVVAPATGSLLMLRVLRHAGVPTVYDPYDCTEGFIKPEYLPPARSIAVERECFRIADRICSRSLEPRYQRRELGYEMAAATFFPDYCWELPRERRQRAPGPEDELHVVYAGGIRPEDRYPSELWGYSQYLEIGRIFAEQGIHLHLYPAPLPGRDAIFERFFSLYLEEQERNPFFHLYRPLPTEELAERLPRYDAALHVLGPGMSDALGWNTEAKLHHSSANKLFDYIEAGLPLILHAGRLQRALVRHYGELVDLESLAETRTALSRLLASPPRKPAKAATLAYHSRRLLEMYRSLSPREDPS